MFTGNMVTEAIPARVFALYRMATSNKGLTRSDLQKLMEPDEIREGQSYFSSILLTAQELKLVDIQDNNVITLVAKEQMKTMEDFRKYGISKVATFEESQFFKVSNTIMNMNELVYKYSSVSDADILNYISSRVGQQITAPMTRGWRFWAQFLGFGYVNNMSFLPNAYIFVKNIIALLGLEKNEEILFENFIISFNKYGKILTANPAIERNMNIAFSSALRELHDNGEVVLKYKNDQDSNWIPYQSNELFNDPVTSIVYKGVKK